MLTLKNVNPSLFTQLVKVQQQNEYQIMDTLNM